MSTVELSYRMEDAVITELKPISGSSQTSTNNTDQPMQVSFTVEYVQTKIFTLLSVNKNSDVSSESITNNTFKGGIPLIESKEKVELDAGFSFTGSFGQTWDYSVPASYSFQFTVPAHSSITVRVVSMEGKCDVPFSYKQLDAIADGNGVFKGTNSFGFAIQVFNPESPNQIINRISPIPSNN